MIHIYTDGSAIGNGQKDCLAGYGYLILDDKTVLLERSVPLVDENITPTSIRAEMMPVIDALRHLKELRPEMAESCSESIRLYSDSAYIINCINQKWYIKWRRNNWKNQAGDRVANKDLWVEILDLYESMGVEFIKVKGHADDEYNNRCDELAKAAVEVQKDNRGRKNGK